jgi:3-oxoacyl-[acyl-carrier protein] reductase
VSSFDFVGQTAVVTGGTRGLGRAMALAFLEAGARVHATWRSDEEAARALVDAAGPAAERLATHRFDVADASSVEAFWAGLAATEPDGVQVLVSNAGIRRDAIVGMLREEDWRAVLDTNLTGSFLMCKQAVLSMMRRRYGRIVLVTSPAAHFGFPGQANYAASKAGQMGLMRSLAREVAARNITVNCVSPGFVETDLVADLDQDLRDDYRKRVPLGRFGRPEEVAWAVLSLAAREASYVNGATLEVTGGL